MSYLGLSKSVVRFFQMYLGHRRQCTIAGNQRSDFRPVTRGVPQGTILGPLLFSLYTADITAGIRYCKTHQYADDTQLYYSFYLSARLEAANNINYDLKQISANSNNHGLKLNEQKTTLLVIGRGRDTLLSDINFNIILNRHILKPQEYGKNLGLSIDSNLRFHEQVNKIIQNSFIKLKHLYKFKDILSSDVKLKLCDTLILSAIEYCGIVY
jgi:ribonuclease P/MRP protein subunit RPP40